jgi:hypothetical protein
MGKGRTCNDHEGCELAGAGGPLGVIVDFEAEETHDGVVRWTGG